ncbi:MAG: gamma carbonic anhydrase family protein [Rhodomicrobium sp.]
MPILALDGIGPELPPIGDYWVAPNAYLIGNVRLGRNVSVWFGSVIRADNEPIEIGDNTNIQENCVLHTDEGVPFKIGRNCSVGHQAVLHGCIIGDDCLIGIGATILNNAVIGSNCLIGSRSLVTERKSIPPNSLVMGVPAKVVRELSPGDAERIKATARHYAEKARGFQGRLSEAV